MFLSSRTADHRPVFPRFGRNPGLSGHPASRPSSRLSLRLALGLALALCLTLGLARPAPAQEAPAKGKTALLLVAFGTSVPEAREAFRAMEDKARAAFPGQEVRWAYTSHIIRKKLAAGGETLPTVEEALDALAKDGFTRVAVQSLQVVPGEEFHKVVRAVQTRAPGFERLTLGQPLMAGTGDLKRLAEILPTCVPAERKPSDTVLFMGHGTAHAAGAFYPALEYYLERQGGRMHVATVEGEPSLEDAVARLKKDKVRTAWLVPLMSVAGDHAQNDMAGSEDGSWVNVLAKAGIKTRPVMKGLGQCGPVADLWIEHLGQAVQALDQAPGGKHARKEQ
jgi:sirohydrochlorin cobaltochelatase